MNAARPTAVPLPGGSPAPESADDLDAIEKIARTCLYEGYLLWPYRRSALKNTKRWTFGGVYPRTRAAALGEPSRMRTEVLLETGAQPRVSVRVRFLHVVERQVHRYGRDGALEPVDSLTVADTLHQTWQEATEREWLLPPWSPEEGRTAFPVEIAGGTDEEPLRDETGRDAGALIRRWEPLTGTVELTATHSTGPVWRIGVTLDNTTPCPRDDTDVPADRDTLAPYAFASTHTVLRCDDGAFLSPADPPETLRHATDSLRNEGTWPVLVDGRPQGNTPRSDPQRARTVLSSPVTLCDFPAVAPESPGDLFDGGEIDQLLILSVLSLTPQEQREARAADPRARAILDRCAALSPRELMALHGAIRDVRSPEESP